MFENAKWIWSAEAEGADCYAEFLTNIKANKGESVQIRICADSNYALYLNGVFVDSGQYADFPEYKVYDEIDVSNFIVSGINQIAVLVWYYGMSFSTYCVGQTGLIFEVEKNGKVVLFSDEHTQSRKSRMYISGRQEKITSQLGFNFHVDRRLTENWMTGVEREGFSESVVMQDMPNALYSREVNKLKVEPCVKGDAVMQGNFRYPSEDMDFGAKMQYAALTFMRVNHGISEDEPLVLNRHSGDGVYVIIDLKSELTGYLDFDLEVAEDCQMEVGWGEHLRDGRCRTSIGTRNFSVTIQLKQGRNCYMNPLRRFGCRYIQFFVHTSELKIRYAGLRPTVYPLKVKTYESENLLRKQIYDVSQHTLMQCMHEHYEDCPWREQAFYTLDSRNQMLCGYYAFEEYEFPRANLRMAAKAIREDGLLPICVPTDLKLCIPTFSLFYIIQTAEYYQYSMDKDTVEACFDAIQTIMHTFLRKIDETGLIPNFPEEEAYWNFYEWQPYLNGETYKGKAYDMCLNALVSLAMDYFIILCEAMGIESKPYSRTKTLLNEKIVQAFYDKKIQLFRIVKGIEVQQVSVLANAYGYLCGAAEGIEQEKMLQIILQNGSHLSGVEVIPATLSMAAYRYDALLKADREYYKGQILDEIDRTYLQMLRENATSFWETEKGEQDFGGAGSLCHGWSAMPIYYYETIGRER